jgi:nitrite reductase/ring-hydroxylating ferredoxin subunit
MKEEAKMSAATLVRATTLAEVRAAGSLTVQANGHTLALFAYGDKVYAVDNRCPHMGFPLDRGTIHDGLLICHWHHARFDLATGGTFDQWADDVRAFPVVVREGEVWVDVNPRSDVQAHQRQRLQDGLERDIPLVIAKAAIGLLENGEAAMPFRAGLEFGVRHRQAGWGQGLTIHTCLMNLLPYLAPTERPRALYHGLSAVAADCDGAPPRFVVRPLPGSTPDLPTLKRWFRQFVEVRDAEGAERCMVSAVRAGATRPQLADLLFAAATDHRYLQIGHVADFTNKAFEALDQLGDEADPGSTERVLTSLAMGYANADRMEEANAWRSPIDLIKILETAFEKLPETLTAPVNGQWNERDQLIAVLLGEDPQAIADSLLAALRSGGRPGDLAETVAYAAALRLARFHTSNEFGDWDTALHTFTFANAVQQGLRRTPSPELVRGVFDAAMSVYLDRFLNVPAARLPEPAEAHPHPAALLGELSALLDRQQQVDTAGALVAHYLYSGGDPNALLAVLGRLLLREDRDFHTLQTVEAAFRQYQATSHTPAGAHCLIAAARYLAAHSPTMRAQGQTYQIAQRLARGEKLFEG